MSKAKPKTKAKTEAPATLATRKRIDSLTDAERGRFAEWVAKWTRVGLSTEPADRPKFEAAVRECYRFTKLDPPKTIVWVQSPIVLAFAAPIAALMIARLRKQPSDVAVGDAVRGAVDVAVGDAVDVAVRVAVGDAVRGAVSDAVRGAVRGAVDVAVGDAVDVAVRDAVGDAVDVAVGDATNSRDPLVRQMRDAISKLWTSRFGGQFWVGGYYWGSPAFASFFRDACGLKLEGDIDDRAIAYQATCESACWWWPHKDFVMVCERPEVISRDAEGRLHSETGMAIRFRDGWGFCSWHGTRVPDEWILAKDSVDASLALTWENIEQRRCLAEIIGWKRVLEKLPNRIIDTDEDAMIGQLIEVDLPDSPRERFLKVLCATNREFVLPVPPEMKSAIQANAWTFGMDHKIYKPEVRT